MKRIFVAGYPKSGNTWLCRLLGQLLDAPVAPFAGANPLCVEGLERESDYQIHQLHLRPVDGTAEKREAAIDNAWRFDYRVKMPAGDRLILIIRDPRDVIVSAFHYWQRDTMGEAAEAVCLGKHPLKALGPWQRFIADWLAIEPIMLDHIHTIKYESLLADSVGALRALVSMMALEPALYSLEQYAVAVSLQSFAATRQRIEQDGADRPYGKEIQLRNMRKGISGDWRNSMTRGVGHLVERHCGEMMELLGYERNRDWWKELP